MADGLAGLTALPGGLDCIGDWGGAADIVWYLEAMPLVLLLHKPQIPTLVIAWSSFVHCREAGILSWTCPKGLRSLWGLIKTPGGSLCGVSI